MTHPEDLLAPYVDGTATGEERIAVEAHLSGCARCRAEVAQASAARTALKALPVVQAPAALMPETSSGGTAVGAGGAPVWYRWGGLAAAAAIVLLLALVLPKLGGEHSASTGAAAASGSRALPETAASVPIEIQQQDLGGQALSSLAAAAAAQPTPSPQPAAAGGGSLGTGDQVTKEGTLRQAQRAQACLSTAFVDVPGRLVRLIAAPFDGSPAFIGLYEQGPGANQPADTVVARAAAVHGCTPLSIAQARFG
jgi:anti-sigma factor RsiW